MWRGENVGRSPDYLAFTRMLLAGGTLDGVEVLKQETVRLMARNAIGDLDVPTVRSNNPALALEVETFPGQVKRWGLTFLINTEDVEGFRAAGSLTWGGIHNTYFWIDLKQRRALSPVNPSRPPSRTTAHDSGSMWFATPSS